MFVCLSITKLGHREGQGHYTWEVKKYFFNNLPEHVIFFLQTCANYFIVQEPALKKLFVFSKLVFFYSLLQLLRRQTQ